MAKESPTTIREGDWEYARQLYEFTDKPTRYIAEAISRSQTMVVQYAGKHGWTRNRRDSEAQRTAVLVAAAKIETAKARDEQFEIIERVNQEMQARVLVEHRADIRRARKLCASLFSELEEMVAHLPELSNLGEILRSEDDRGRDKMNDAYKKLLSLPERSSSLRALSECLKTLISLERQAFGIQGALEDPEKPEAVAGVSASGMDKILDRFASVLKPPGTVNVPVSQVVDATP